MIGRDAVDPVGEVVTTEVEIASSGHDEAAALSRALRVAAVSAGPIGEIDVRASDRTLIRDAEGQKENARSSEGQPTGGI